jgi:hypothetical protein
MPGQLYAWSMALQSDGSIVLAGDYDYGNGTPSDLMLARYIAAGVPVATFGTNGVVLASASGTEYGHPVVNGQNPTLRRPAAFMVARNQRISRCFDGTDKGRPFVPKLAALVPFQDLDFGMGNGMSLEASPARFRLLLRASRKRPVSGRWPLALFFVCAVTRRGSSAGAIPARHLSNVANNLANPLFRLETTVPRARLRDRPGRGRQPG